MFVMVGDIITGPYSEFDDYDVRRVEAVGVDWVVARKMGEDSLADFASGTKIHEKMWQCCHRNPEADPQE